MMQAKRIILAIANGIGRSSLEIISAAIELLRNAIEPTEISILPVMMTNASPDAMINKGAAVCKTDIAAVNEKKLGEATEKVNNHQ